MPAEIHELYYEVMILGLASLKLLVQSKPSLNRPNVQIGQVFFY